MLWLVQTMMNLSVSTIRFVGRCGPRHWHRLAQLCLLYTLAPLNVYCGNPPDPGKSAKAPAFDQLAMAWLSDIHLQTQYSLEASPADHCIKGRKSTRGLYKMGLEMETDPGLGRAGCASPPRLVDQTLDFLQGLVAQSSRSTAAGDILLGPDGRDQAAATAFRDYPLPPIRTVLLTGDYTQLPENRDRNLMYARLWYPCMVARSPI